MTYNFKLSPLYSILVHVSSILFMLSIFAFLYYPFPIREALRLSGGPVVYKVHLPKNLSTVHNMFYVSQLKKCLRVPEHVVEIFGVNLELDLTHWECSVKVLD